MSNNIEDIYLLSPTQQGLLFHTLYAPQSEAYFIQTSWTIDAELNLTAFRAAWQAAIERHPILRSACIWEGRAKPLQVVRRSVELPYEEHDWRSLAATEQQERFETFRKEDQQCGFDMAQAPLMRLTLIRLTDNRYKFIWSHHHILLDGWSNSIVLKEVLVMYEALIRGEQGQIARPRPYRDYITWLRQQDIAKAESYWREYLKGFRAPTPLGVDYTQKHITDATRSIADESPSFSERQRLLTPQSTQALRKLARHGQLTLNTLVQGAWAVLLSRYSGESDVVFGATVSGRPAELSGVEEMVGLFINTLPVRAQLKEEKKVVEWLRELQEQQVEMREYEYSPLVQVQGWSEVGRGVSLFESIVVFENYPVDAMLREQVGSLTISDVQSLERTSYPLSLIVGANGEELLLYIAYQEGRFEGVVIERMLEHLERLLAGIAADPEQRLADIPLLTTGERHQLLSEWNATQREYPTEYCLHQLFEQQVERTPEAIALVFEDQQLSYAELNERANQLAHHLHTLGVGAETLVGICVERSLEMVVGLLGILKAGGAYVPLDPDYPQERLSFMLEDAAVKVLLTQERLADRLSQQNAQIFYLDKNSETLATKSAKNPVNAIAPDNLAYMIYTSGSTGQPKGATNTHRAICNRLLWMQEAYQLSEADRVLQKTPYSFDVSVWEFFWPLLVGARLVVARPGGHQDSSYLIELIAQQGITTLHFVPSMLNMFLEAPQLERCESLRRVMSSGEALTPELQERFYARINAELHNLYGPTEAAVDVTFWACERDDGRGFVPIGRPVANTQIYILDKRGDVVPMAVAGELHIGGVQLARGYHNRADMTAEKFIPHSFSNEAGARLYRTGDLARFLPAGEIEYIGRIDTQVKVRGFRIELGEIETVISSQQGVRECAVLAREVAPGDVRLVAYVVPVEGEALDVNELRRALREWLPEYMIPATFMTLDEMPLTPSGKVDRRALPAPQQSRPDLDKQYAAPQNEIEQKIVAIWQEVLQVERVGIHDNFFDLGGHSLLILQMQGKLHEQLQSNLSMVEMFKHPTVHSLAERLMRREAEPEDHEPQGEKMIEQLQEGKGRLRQQLKQRQAAMRGSVLNG